MHYVPIYCGNPRVEYSTQVNTNAKERNAMDNVLDFLRAAMPWVAMGLLLAVFAARSAKKKNEEEQSDDYGTEGMCLGMCFGAAIGTSLGNHTGIGICLGMLLGLAIGSRIKKEDSEGTEGQK